MKNRQQNRHPSPLDPWPPRPPDPRPRLTFSPLAWLKLQFFLHAGDTEVGGFGVASEHDPLYVEDFVTVRQRTTAVGVEFEDAAVADYVDACVDGGLTPARFFRLWVHTHPGDSPSPSLTDEETYARVFGPCDWAVMFIVSRTCRTYARLRFSAGPGGELLLPIGVDWAAWPRLLGQTAEAVAQWLPRWRAEFERNVIPRRPTLKGEGGGQFDLENLHERQAIEDELVARFEALGGWDPYDDATPRQKEVFHP